MQLPNKLLLALIAAAPLIGVDKGTPAGSVTAHEWGTFTSVAGEDGRPTRWLLLSGPSDLPCFVNRLAPHHPKAYINALVRMETPVLYFYSQKATTLDVRVGFPRGLVTEWYPQAKVSPWTSRQEIGNGSIAWKSVEVLPGATPVLPTSKVPNHYFAARETDAAPLRVGGQWESLLFYRGVGNLDVPLRATVSLSGRVQLRNSGAEAVPLAILFENRGGRLGYRVANGAALTDEMDSPELNASLPGIRALLIGHLIEAGLYPKEAEAMVETWSDSWFEEGMRVFYLVPRATVDALLPLEIQPAPASVARVFVGRMELLSPAMRQTIENAAAKSDVQTLAKFGRFLEPFTARIGRSAATDAAMNRLFQQTLDGPACVQ